MFVPWYSVLVRKRKGQKIRAHDWNHMRVSAHSKSWSARHNDFVIGRTVTSRRGTAEVTVVWVRIIAADGAAPPFIYSAVEVEPAANGTFIALANGLEINASLFNIGEVDYPGAGKLPVGRVVMAWPGFEDEYVCDVLNYRGVYPLMAP